MKDNLKKLITCVHDMDMEVGAKLHRIVIKALADEEYAKKILFDENVAFGDTEEGPIGCMALSLLFSWGHNTNEKYSLEEYDYWYKVFTRMLENS